MSSNDIKIHMYETLASNNFSFRSLAFILGVQLLLCIYRELIWPVSVSDPQPSSWVAFRSADSISIPMCSTKYWVLLRVWQIIPVITVRKCKLNGAKSDSVSYDENNGSVFSGNFTTRESREYFLWIFLSSTFIIINNRMIKMWKLTGIYLYGETPRVLLFWH